MAGLASLTANYTDSEDEDDVRRRDEQQDEDEDEDKQGKKEDSKWSRSGEAVKWTPASAASVASVASNNSAKSTPTAKMPTRLVSYMEEEDEDEINKSKGEEQPVDEAKEKTDNDDNDDVVSMDLDSENDGEDEVKDGKDTQNEETKIENQQNKTQEELINDSTSSGIQVEAWSGGVQLPPEPPGQCGSELQERIRILYKRKQDYGYDMNSVIQNKKAFRNPSIYEKLIQFCDIDEMGTNFPKELYDGHLFGKESYYDELAKVQAADMERREKAAKSAKSVATSVPVVKSSQQSIKSEAQKPRRSKWDQGGAPMVLPKVGSSGRPPTKPNLPLPNVPAPQVVSASAASAQSSASGKAISAFGPLKK